MIFLIGGPPRCGKTTLAKKLAERLRIGWASVDALESIADAYTPSKKHAELFPKTYLCEKTGWENDSLYNNYSKEEILGAYIRQGHASERAVCVFVRHMIEHKHDFILEGHQLHPKLMHELIKEYPKDLRTALITKTDIQGILIGFEHNRTTPDWTTEQTRDPSVLPKIADMLSGFGEWIESEARKYSITCFHMDMNFRNAMADAVRYFEDE